MHARLVWLSLLLATTSLVFTSTASAVTINWAIVGDPGNAADTTGYGAVADVYQMSEYEVTNTQYTEFLNAVAATDTNNLYNVNMGQYHPIYGDYGGITRSGSPGSYSYSVRTDMDDKPVIFVSFWDALRFANWLHNGQPIGIQDDTTTEDGAYTITAQGIADNTITRNPGAVIFLPSEDEWYKAAYYDGVSSYFDYPASSSMTTTCWLPGPMSNTANCNDIIDPPNGDLVAVGVYSASASPSGTFDQGGNVYEWNEAIVLTTRRGLRGGSWANVPSLLAATQRSYVRPANEYNYAGFRVARTPFTCGNGLVEGVEACDDGGTTPGDGCGASCQVETGWVCLGEPSVCSICGDGAILGLEQCDDADSTPHDGCSASCQIETGWVCTGEPSVCTEHILPTLSPWSQLALVVGLVVGTLLATGVGAWRRRAA